VAHTFIKAERIAAQALGILEREIVLPALVWRNAGGSFVGAAGDTITMRVPARTTARTRVLRGARGTASEGEGIITMDELTETSVDVTLDTAVYSAVPITDEQLTLDISDFGAQVAEPQVRAIAEGVENAVIAEMTGATYATTINIPVSTASDDIYDSLVDARVALNKANVPMSERYLVVGSDFEGVLLKSDDLHQVDRSGSDSALRDADIGSIAGFSRVIVSNGLPSDQAYAFHRTAYVLNMQAPAIPAGASYGTSRAYANLSLRWIRDYDFRNVQDRSMFDVYIGTNVVADGADTAEVQTVTITGTPTGGTFTLTFNGQTTAGIAFNAAASAVQTALNNLSNLDGVVVTGSAGGPYTVTFGSAGNVNPLTASGSGLTGGTSPAVAVTTATGGSPTLVRAVKLELV
jgi:P22 coat protein - gene protein 5